MRRSSLTRGFFLVGSAAVGALGLWLVCQSTIPKPMSAVTESRNIRQTIDVVVDPRIELLAIVQFLGHYEAETDLMTNDEFSYKDDVRSHFSPFREHRAVRLFDEINPRFRSTAPLHFMLHLSPSPDRVALNPLAR